MKGATRRGQGKHSWYTVGKFDIIRQYTDNEHNGRWTVREHTAAGHTDHVSAFNLTAAVEFCRKVMNEIYAQQRAEQEAAFKAAYPNGYDAGRELFGK